MEWNWAGSDIFTIHIEYNGFRISLKGAFSRRVPRLRTIKMVIVEGGCDSAVIAFCSVCIESVRMENVLNGTNSMRKDPVLLFHYERNFL